MGNTGNIEFDMRYSKVVRLCATTATFTNLLQSLKYYNNNKEHETCFLNFIDQPEGYEEGQTIDFWGRIGGL